MCWISTRLIDTGMNKAPATPCGRCPNHPVPPRLITPKYPPNNPGYPDSTLRIPACVNGPTSPGPVSARRTELVTSNSRLVRAGRRARWAVDLGPGLAGSSMRSICHSFLSTILFGAASLRNCGAHSWLVMKLRSWRKVPSQAGG